MENVDEEKYFIIQDNRRVAENMDLETAAILVKAMFERYWADKKMLVCVGRMNQDETVKATK